jgi:hypothetical protein
MATTDLTRAKYAGLDFDTISDDLRARLQVKFAADFNDFAISSMGIVLMDMVAYGLDTLSFYLDQRATDSFLTTARTRGSVARLTRQLGYKMGPAVASSVDLEVNLKAVYAFPVLIPKGTKFKGPNDLVFESAEDVTFAANTPITTKKSIPCYEGETINESFTSDGSVNQAFRMRRVPDKKFIVSGSVKVMINAAPWSETDFLKFEQSNLFEVGYNDEPPTLRFGNGRTGNVPAAGATISVSYVASRGRSGQVAKGKIDQLLTPLVVNFQTISVAVTNPSGSIGGDDPESLEQAKVFAPLVFRSRRVAITRTDYEALAGSYADPLFGRVAVAQALSTKSAATDVELEGYLETIDTAVENPASSAAPILTAGSAATTALTGYGTADLPTIYSAALTNTNSINTDAAAALTQVRLTKNKSQEVANDANDINAIIGTGGTLRSFIGTLAASGSTTLSSADRATIVAYLDSLKAEADDIGSLTGQIGAAATSAAASLGSVTDAVARIGVGTPGATTQLGLLNTAASNVVAQAAIASAKLTAMNTLIVEAYTTVADATAAIADHFTRIYSGDCNTNVVTVPILARDAGGFYAAPSIGLVHSLQNYLDARKEVTQTVIVTSGADYLLPAKMTVRVGVRDGYVLTVVQTSVIAAIDGLLRDRKFKQSLYVSDVEDAAQTVPGVQFVNVTILGHLDRDGTTVLATKLDVSGNLIAQEQDIITKGSVTVSVESV